LPFARFLSDALPASLAFAAALGLAPGFAFVLSSRAFIDLPALLPDAAMSRSRGGDPGLTWGRACAGVCSRGLVIAGSVAAGTTGLSGVMGLIGVTGVTGSRGRGRALSDALAFARETSAEFAAGRGAIGVLATLGVAGTPATAALFAVAALSAGVFSGSTPPSAGAAGSPTGMPSLARVSATGAAAERAGVAAGRAPVVLAPTASPRTLA
jgi:hypothetical protein